MKTSNIKKEKASENLRMIMAKLKISAEGLARKAKISRYQVDNILYCRALRPETVAKISSALGVRTEQLLGTDDTFLSKEFDIKTYAKIVNLIEKVLEKNKLKCSRLLIEMISNVVYKNSQEIENMEEAIKGIVFFLKDTDPDLKDADTKI